MQRAGRARLQNKAPPTEREPLARRRTVLPARFRGRRVRAHLPNAARPFSSHAHRIDHRKPEPAGAFAPACVRLRPDRARPRSAATPTALIFLQAGRSVAPISRGMQTPSDSSGGVFVSGVRKGFATKPLENPLFPHAPEAPEAKGTSRRGALCAVPGCFGTGGACAEETHQGASARTHCRLATGGDTEHPRPGVYSGTGSHPVRCARHCRGVCRRRRADVPSMR